MDKTISGLFFLVRDFRTCLQEAWQGTKRTPGSAVTSGSTITDWPEEAKRDDQIVEEGKVRPLHRDNFM